MYMIPEMIDLGLKGGQQFPSVTHRTVAVNLAIGNPRVNQCEQLHEIIEAVLKVPATEIGIITYSELVLGFGLPKVLG